MPLAAFICQVSTEALEGHMGAYAFGKATLKGTAVQYEKGRCSIRLQADKKIWFLRAMSITQQAATAQYER